MNKYILFIGCLILGCMWLWIWRARMDLRKKIWRASILGGLIGPLSEIWYFQDYWKPLTLFGQGIISIEDFLFGFFITGISVSIFDFVTKTGEKHKKPQQWKILDIMFLAGLGGLIFFNNYLGINSILVSSGIFLVLSFVMILIRKDLWKPSILSGFFMILLAVVLYHILFNILAPEYWNHYWLLANTKLGITVFGNIPLTEILWYFSWGCFAGIEYDFVYGEVKVKK